MVSFDTSLAVYAMNTASEFHGAALGFLADHRSATGDDIAAFRRHPFRNLECQGFSEFGFRESLESALGRRVKSISLSRQRGVVTFQDDDGSGLERVGAHMLEDKRRGFVEGISRVKEERPIHLAAACAEAEGYDGVAGV